MPARARPLTKCSRLERSCTSVSVVPSAKQPRAAARRAVHHHLHRAYRTVNRRVEYVEVGHLLAIASEHKSEKDAQYAKTLKQKTAAREKIITRRYPPGAPAGGDPLPIAIRACVSPDTAVSSRCGHVRDPP